VASVKGTIFMSSRAFVVERFGEEAWGLVMAKLVPEDREVLAGAVVMGWYPMGLYERVCRACDRVLGDGTMSLMVPMGRYAAEHDLKILHRIFLRLVNPAMVLEKGTDLWKRYQDSGQWEIKRLSPFRLVASLTGWGITDEIVCVRLSAWCGRMLELVGGNQVVIHRLRCIGRGDGVCQFEAHWK
jgi:predicted hydrocarbon binding protein